MQITLDKIASVTSRVQLPLEVEVSNSISAERGAVVIVEALEEKDVYGELELVGGQMERIRRGDRIAGVLGERQALRGFVGSLPQRVEVGDILHILNMGGVIGHCVSANTDFGKALQVRVIGAAMLDGAPAKMSRGALPWRVSLDDCAPLVLVSGSCMNAGKTTAACEIIRILSERGYRLAAAKLAGVATQRDLINMRERGAVDALSFSDAGLPSTTNTDSCLVPAAKGVLAALNESNPDAIVVEFGDGIMGHYGVELLLRDAEIAGYVGAHVFCANDLVAAWGGLRFLDEFGLSVDCVSGPATDNSAGVSYIENRFGVPAANGRGEPERLATIVEGRLLANHSSYAKEKVVA